AGHLPVCRDGQRGPTGPAAINRVLVGPGARSDAVHRQTGVARLQELVDRGTEYRLFQGSPPASASGGPRSRALGLAHLSSSDRNRQYPTTPPQHSAMPMWLRI